MADGRKKQEKQNSFRKTMNKFSGKFGGDVSEAGQRDPEQERERLLDQIASMEEELNTLRQSGGQLDQAFKQNEKLTAALIEAKNRIDALKEEVEKLTSPPATYAIFSGVNDDESINVYVSGRKMRVLLHPDISGKDIKIGQQLVLNEALNAIEVCGFEPQGEVVRVKDVLDPHRLVVTLRGEEELVVELASPLLGEHISIGDHLLLDAHSGYVLEKLPKSEVEEVVLEEIPDVSYDNIGGLESQIEQVRDAVELPFLHAELFSEHKLLPPKGVLLYGPPGCGKTLIAKAVAASISEKLGDKKSGKDLRSFFLHVKGPEPLNKYVGESERQIREVFKKAKERADTGHPVIIFFDEMDALFRTRGTGVSSDMEATIVPQFLAEIDGVERLRNVIVIGATNRQDLLDPAILRAGRLDIKIKIERPNKEGAMSIFKKYLTADLPFHPDEMKKSKNNPKKIVESLMKDAVAEMYSVREENKFLEVTYANGEKETFFFKDFASGAMIEGVVSRAKKHAIKRFLDSGVKGLKSEDLILAIKQEFKENEDLPNTTNPDDWAKIAGRSSEKIVHIRTMAGSASETREVETVATGHYL
ncbi:MAG: proteasome ATPase [Nitrospirota bacterium]|nr:proteasome ATPase [Nitrospirota bacterium]